MKEKDRDRLRMLLAKWLLIYNQPYYRRPKGYQRALSAEEIAQKIVEEYDPPRTEYPPTSVGFA